MIDRISTLIRCACGHGIGVHTGRGCRAAEVPHCGCTLSDGEVLDRAIAQAAIDLQAEMPPGRRRARVPA